MRERERERKRDKYFIRVSLHWERARIKEVNEKQIPYIMTWAYIYILTFLIFLYVRTFVIV